jgi:hypothetical protein
MGPDYSSLQKMVRRVVRLPEPVAAATILAWLLVSVGCAARARPPASPTIADADRLAAVGCYTCLVDALKIYDAILAGRPSQVAMRGAFRTALLLAVREKEIGLPASTYLSRARTLAETLPPTEHAAYAVEIAAALPWDFAGLAKEFTEEFITTRQAATPQVNGWREQLRSLRADSFFAYLDASLACSYGDWRARDATLDEIAALQPSSLMVQYRLGACVPSRRAALERVLATEPGMSRRTCFGRTCSSCRQRREKRRVIRGISTAYRVPKSLP